MRGRKVCHTLACRMRSNSAATALQLRTRHSRDASLQLATSLQST